MIFNEVIRYASFSGFLQQWGSSLVICYTKISYMCSYFRIWLATLPPPLRAGFQKWFSALGDSRCSLCEKKHHEMSHPSKGMECPMNVPFFVVCVLNHDPKRGWQWGCFQVTWIVYQKTPSALRMKGKCERTELKGVLSKMNDYTLVI